MRNENIASIIELIHSGNDIYKKAIDNIDNTSLNHVLQDLVHVREHAALELKPYAIANSQTADDTPVSYTIKAREVYSDVMKEVSSDKESMYLEQLEGVESKVLKESSPRSQSKQITPCYSKCAVTSKAVKKNSAILA
ncbi:ferritin-like domain-containing protein [Vibrio parahaemolyticus]